MNCKDCKHWDIHYSGKLAPNAVERGLGRYHDTGYCELLGVNEFKEIGLEENLGYEEISTHKDFGCIHFENITNA